MTYTEKIQKLIVALNTLTTETKISWAPFPEYIELTNNIYAKKYMVEYNRYLYSSGTHPIISEYTSKACSISGGAIFLVNFIETKSERNYYILAYQDSPNRPIKELTAQTDFQNELMALSISISSQEDPGFQFIDEIINLANE
ncbi:MAG: hypothetical protein ABT01_02945 [Clostridium sp. SCN 57-10]|nr:MAG: hypothetical protein ABT01_02945 [Clostridium sp. SCN 57-10]